MSTPPSEIKIGLALSGGGFRAAAFHLGVLKRLEELGVLSRLAVLSTVSGGSMTGALYALRCAMHGEGVPGSYPVQQLIDEMRPFLASNLRGKALFGTPFRVWCTVLSFVVHRFRRMPLVVSELDRSLFRGARIGELPSWIVINATSLKTGKSWKFYRDCAGDYLAGVSFQVGDVRVAEAVGASAAYPLLVDPYPFRTRWEDLQDPPADRWERPPVSATGGFSRWRSRYGKPRGRVTIPLVDGGIYDNEGVNSLRSLGVTHAVISSTAAPEADFEGRGEFRTLPRTIDVMHSRLGAVTRQWVHEMTHGVHPGEVRKDLQKLRDDVMSLAVDHPELNLGGLADRLSALAAVGWPPRGRQFRQSVQILLHRTDLARNAPAKYDPPYDVPETDRGLTAELIEELSRVRTDLDALGEEVVDLLVAQGYFLTDAHVKTVFPELIQELNGVASILDPAVRPDWGWAREVARAANSHPEHTRTILVGAQARSLIGRSGKPGEFPRIAASMIVGFASTAAIVVLFIWWIISFACDLL